MLASARVSKWQKGLKEIAAGSRQWKCRLLLRLLCDLREQELLSTQLPIPYLNDISQNHTGFWYLLQEKTQGIRTSKRSKKLKWRPRAMILSSVHFKVSLSNQNNFMLNDRIWVYSTAYRAHRTGWGNFFFHFQVLVNFLSWKTNHCVQSRGQGEEAVWDKPCLDPLLMLLGTSDMFLVLHPLYQPSQSWGQAQDERQKKFCFKSYSLLRSWWCWSFRRWKSATAHSWDGTGGPHSMFCIDWCSNAWCPCGTDLEENSRLYPVGYRENWSLVI